MTWAIIAYLAAGLIDLITTSYGLRSGQFKEGNPVARWIEAKAGIAGLAASKLVILGIGWWSHRAWVVWILAGLQLIVGVSNGLKIKAKR